MNEQGKPLFFDPDIYLSAIEMMINADEVERALWMLDNFPAYYRDNPTRRALEIREALHRAVWTPVQYKGIYQDVVIDENHTKTHWPLRAQALEKIVRAQNEAGKTPYIMELAGGSNWIEAGLGHKGLKVDYAQLSLDEPRALKYHPTLDQTTKKIFVCFELIEHLSNEFEIYQNYLKFGPVADVIILSTPLYTYNGGMPNWSKRELGHLRTYTPKDFVGIASKMFLNKEWSMTTGDGTMVLVGST